MDNTRTVRTNWGACPFIEFVSEVDRLLHEQFGIESVDLEGVAAAQEAGETPQEHVDWLARQYDLCPLTPAETKGDTLC